jgi:hypothetical protein
LKGVKKEKNKKGWDQDNKAVMYVRVATPTPKKSISHKFLAETTIYRNPPCIVAKK